MPVDRNKLWAKLDELGEEEVRALLGQSTYGSVKKPHVEEWLRKRDQARQDALKREEIDIARDAASSARDAANAARDAADEAKEANRLAKKANIIAKTAMAVATITAIVSIIAMASG